MKNIISKLSLIISFLIIYNLTFNIDNCKSQWVKMPSGLSTGWIHCITSNGVNVYTGTMGKGFYLSTNYGLNWFSIGMTGANVLSLMINGNTIYGGLSNYGIYYTSNNGAFWCTTSLTKSVYSLAFSGNNLLAGTDLNGIYYTSDNGENWFQSNLNNRIIRSIVKNGSIVFAGSGKDFSGSGGVFISTDNGVNWIQSSLNNESVSSLAVDGNNIFAGTVGSGVFLSTNNGINWIHTSLYGKAVYTFVVYGNIVLAGTISDGVYLSSDYGINWVEKNEGFSPIPSVESLILSNNYIFAGTEGDYIWRRPLSDITGIKTNNEGLPFQFYLFQNYPNPFNPATNIRYELPNSGFVNLVVYDALGREVETLVNEKQTAGTYEATFNASQYSSGLYFYRLTADNFSETKKMLLIK